MQQPKIIVVIRKRPLSKKETSKGQSDIITVKNKETVIVSEYKQKVDLTKYLQETIFNFDYGFDQYANNQQIYDCAVKPLVDSAFQGAKVTCFAYGQTGSGKTFTMNGSQSLGVVGLYTLGAQDIFQYLENPQFSHLVAKLSFFEIYCGKLYDLLNKRQELKIREDNKSNINVVGLQQIEINAVEQFVELLNHGTSQRITSQNSANSESSRSHAILQVILKQKKRIHGKISFVDLAGNQRGADHMDMNKQTRIDGAEINKSLLSLKECIRALDQGKGHTPFRGSKLTMVLKDSFIGFCRTVMIGNVSPSSASSQNTLNTLRYADRVKQLRKPQDAQQNKQQMKARQLMLPRQNKNAIKIEISNDDDMQDIQKKRQDAQKNFGIKAEIPKNLGIISTGQQKNNIYTNTNPPISKGNIPLNEKNQIRTSASNNKNVISPSPGLVKKVSIASNNPSTGSNVRKSFSHTQNNPILKNSGVLNNPSQKVPGINMPNMHASKGAALSSRFNNQKGNINGVNNVSFVQDDSLMDIQGDTRGHYQPHSSKDIAKYGISSANSNLIKQEEKKNKIHQFNRCGSQYLMREKEDRPALSKNNFINTVSTSNDRKFVVQNSTPGLQDPDIISKGTDPKLLQQIHQKLSKQLIEDETSLLENHSNTLRTQINTIKGEMSLISDIQRERNTISTRNYVVFMREQIEAKLSKLQSLREQLVEYRYKLDEVQQIERVVNGANDDQQLLDDL